KMAQVQWSQEANRDPVKTYNPMPLKDIAAKAPNIDWKAYFAAADLTDPPFVSITQPSYTWALAKLVKDHPIDVWKTYLRVRLLDAMATKLPAGFRDASYQFHDVALTGLKQDKPRWQRGVAAVNGVRAAQFDYHRQTVRNGKPVDRTEWGMTPQTVNAYYDANKNEIVFPAAILQPPFFDMKADDATNYGAIGAVIGHEISHGFDDQGSRSDAQGNLVNWWAEDDRARFNAKTDKLVAQYDACVVLKDLHVNGHL